GVGGPCGAGGRRHQRRSDRLRYTPLRSRRSGLPRPAHAPPPARLASQRRLINTASRYKEDRSRASASLVDANQRRRNEMGCADRLGDHSRRWLRAAFDLANAGRDAPATGGGQPDPAAADPEPLPACRRTSRPLDHLPDSDRDALAWVAFAILAV